MAFYFSSQSGYRKPGHAQIQRLCAGHIHPSIGSAHYIDHSLFIAVEIQMETGSLHEAEYNLYEPLTLLPDSYLILFAINLSFNSEQEIIQYTYIMDI